MMKLSEKRRGQSTVELVTGVIIFIPVVLLFIDVALMVMSATTNDNVCREAARAASKVPPNQSQARAQQIIDTANKNAGTVSSYTMQVNVTADALAYIANPPQEGGIVPGSVTVSTTCQVHPLTILKILDGSNAISFNTSQSFPFTYVVPQSSSPN